MKDVLRELNTKFGNLNKEIDDQRKDHAKKIVDDLRNAAKVTKNLLEDKIDPCLTLPLIVSRKTENARVREEAVKAAQKDANEQYEKQFETIQAEYNDRLESIKNQFEELCIQKRDDIEQNAVAFEKYLAVKNARIDGMRNELIALYEISVKHDTVIQKVEVGAFNNGIVTMRIPEKDKQSISLPTQSKYPELFKTLTKEKHLAGQSTKITRAHEVYMKKVRQTNMEKAKKTGTANDEKKISSIDLNKLDTSKATPHQLAGYCRDLVQAQTALNKEEETLLIKLATLENLKRKSDNRSVDDLSRELQSLKVELQDVVKVNKTLTSQVDKNKRALEKSKLKFAKTNHTAWEE